MTREHIEEMYYAVLPAEKAEHHETLYFWFSNYASRGFPSDYGWSNREQDKKYASKEILMEFLHNTLALEVDRGHWSLDEVEGVQIHKVIEKTITTTEDTLENYGAGIKEIKKLGKQRYGWDV
jgi:hypothetical protein